MDRNPLLEVLGKANSFSDRPGATARDLDSVETALGHRLPEEHREFLARSNGGELVAGEQAIDFWDTTRIAERNARLGIAQWLPGVVLVASNEGETALGFDCETAHPIAVPFGDLTRETTRSLGDSLGAAVAKVISGELDLDEVCYE